MIYIGRFRVFIFEISPRCQTLSKAWNISRKAVVVYFLFSKSITKISDTVVVDGLLSKRV